MTSSSNILNNKIPRIEPDDSRTKEPLTCAAKQWVKTHYRSAGLYLRPEETEFYAVSDKNFGLSNAHIALYTSIITLPWALKFLWAPFLERLPSKRDAVIYIQIMLGLIFGLMA